LDEAVVASDGEHFALNANGASIEPGVDALGTRAVFSRTPVGWTMKSATAPGMAGDTFAPELLSPDLAQIAFMLIPKLNAEANPTGTDGTLDAGPVGGPYATLASIPEKGEETRLAGANAGEPLGVPAFSDILFESQDRALLPPGPERKAAEATNLEKGDLYEWTGGRLQLVNVEGEGARVKLINHCGAMLGAGHSTGNALNAVSADGSKVFFTSPGDPELPGCPEPQLYVRINGRETVDVSEPEGVSIAPSDRGRVGYDGASADGSEVFFTTATALTPDAGAGFHLYEYNTEAPKEHRLTLVANEVSGFGQFINPSVVVSEDGSTVYYQGAFDGLGSIFRYEAATGLHSFVAVPSETPFSAHEPSYATSDGGFLVFASGPEGVRVAGRRGLPGLEYEGRGLGHNELYRYDAADGSVMCVSCGEGVAPAEGGMIEPESFYGLLTTPDSQATAISISEDGRRVFFQTSAQLAPQDRNKSTAREAGLGSGADVYEWEEDGTEEAPGVVCHVANGCTHLISAGEAVGPERFLGASADGDNVFFTSAAQLVPQATPEFTNIYDARVDGGFPPPTTAVECTSCQGVGSPPPAFSAPASGTFAGQGSPAGGSSAPVSKPKPKLRCRRGHRRGRSGRCVRVVPRRRVGRP
jgi:hypothetical protein